MIQNPERGTTGIDDIDNTILSKNTDAYIQRLNYNRKKQRKNGIDHTNTMHGMTQSQAQINAYLEDLEEECG